MQDERAPAPSIHPRVLHRLSDTLSSRLKDIETSRRQVQELMTGVRSRIDYLENTFGLPLDECRAECDWVLGRVDELGTLTLPTLPTQEEIEALLQRVIRLFAMISTIDSAGFSRRSSRPDALRPGDRA